MFASHLVRILVYTWVRAHALIDDHLQILDRETPFFIGTKHHKRLKVLVYQGCTH